MFLNPFESYREVLLPGNYSNRLQNNQLTQAQIVAQLKYVFPAYKNNESMVEVGYIHASDTKNNGNYQRLLSVLSTPFRGPVMPTLYYNRTGIDFCQRQLLTKNLILYDLSNDFNKLEDSSIFAPDRISEMTKTRVIALSSIIIFSNNEAQTQFIYDSIQSLTAPHPMPLIFIAKTEFNKMDSTSFNANIAGILNCNGIQNKSIADDWWGQYRSGLDQLALNMDSFANENIIQTGASKEEVKEKYTRCAVM